MARPREFDPDIALDGAMDIFWRQGFKATNLPDLLTAMGLTRGSFYKAFGEKESVYIAALDRYDQRVISKGVAALDACEGPRAEDCLSLLFSGGADQRRGCFICNAMVEMAPDNPVVARKASAMADRLRDAIQRVLDRHGVAGGGGKTATADLVLHLYFGQQATGKAGYGGLNWRAQLSRLLQDTGG